MTVLQDEDVQKKGLVSLVFALQPPIKDSIFSFNFEAVAAAASLRNVLPARYASSHYCFTQESFLTYVNWEQRCLRKGSSTPSNACLHHGSTMELFFDLQRFGISASCAPVDVFGTEIKVSDHEEWLEAQKFKELLENWGPTEDDFPDFVLDDLEPAPIKKNSTNAVPLGCPTLPQLLLNPFSSDPVTQILYGQHSSINPKLIQPSETHNTTAQLIGHSQNFVDRLQQQQQQQTIVGTQGLITRGPKTSIVDKNQISNFDVLFGRGKVKDHYGNIYLHHLIAMKQGRYEAAERWEKTLIAEEIISIIRDRGGRFLKQSSVNANEPWTVVDADTAREKVSHTFRSRRPKLHNSSILFSVTSKH
jgi:hypothetical protein